MYRLHIIPVNFKNMSHKLFTLQNSNLSSDNLTEFELKDLLLDIKIPLCVGKDIFTIHSQNDPFWSYEKKRFIRIMYYVSELQNSMSDIVGLLEKNFCIDIFVDQPFDPDLFSFLSNISVHPANLRFIVIENKSVIQSQDSIFKTIPSLFKSSIYFLYLPPISNYESMLSAAEVMSRIEDRRRECQENRENLKILSITNNQVFKDEPYRKIFYLNPIRENYYKYQEQLRLSSAVEDRDRISSLDFYLLKSHLMTKKLTSRIFSLFLFFVWKFRHIYWSCEHFVTFGVSKILSKLKKAYWSIFSNFGFVRVQLIKLFWAMYTFTANLGIFIQNTPGKVYKICVECYWVSRKMLGTVFNLINATYWQMRKILSFTFNILIQFSWESKSFLSIFFINLYWSFRKMISSSLNFVVQFSWKLKSNFSISTIRLYWILRKSISGLLNFCVQSYWKIRASKYMRPFFKIYWFTSFQFNKRIVSLFKKKSNL